MKLYKILPITGIALITHMQAATLNFTGAGSFLAGPGTANNLTAGTSVLYSNVGTDDFGNTFDAVVTLDSRGGSGTLNSALPDAFLHTNGNADTWGAFTLSFIAAGSSTATNPFGNALSLVGVSSFTAQDIDSSSVNANNSDVFGLFTNGLETSITRGSSLVNDGFIHDTGQPITGVDYSRLNPANGGTLTTFNGEGPVNADNVNNQAIYAYNNETISSFQFVWGTTSTAPTGTLNSGNRGLLGEIEFTGLAPIPEPSSVLLFSSGCLALLIRRRRT